jgi:hypothetical protein
MVVPLTGDMSEDGGLPEAAGDGNDNTLPEEV